MSLLADIERAVITEALDCVGWDHKPDVARLLGVSLGTLYNRIASYGLEPPPEPGPLLEFDADRACFRVESGEQITIDAADAEIIRPHRWGVMRPARGRDHRYVYAITHIGRSLVLLHRLLTGAPPGMVVDHKNGDTLDNRRDNLARVHARGKPSKQLASTGRSIGRDQMRASQALDDSSQILGREPARDAGSSAVERGPCTPRATSTPAEILDLYRRLRAAEPESEEFEALNAQFNRICNADPEGVAVALRLEAHTA